MAWGNWCRIVVLGAAFASSVASAADASLHLRVGVYENAPKVSLSASGPRGIFPEILESVARGEGWSIEYVPGTFAQGMDRLARGDIDLMVDVARSEHRQRIYAFPEEPVLHSWNQIYARPHSGIRSVLDLTGRRVAVLQGSVQHDLFTELAAAFGVRPSLQVYPDLESAVAAVVQARADAIVTNPFHGAFRARAQGLEDTAIIFAPSDLYFAARRHVEPAVLATLDRRLRAMKADPTSVYFASLRRWTPPSDQLMIPRWLQGTALAGCVLLALCAAWAFTLLRSAAKLRRSETLQRRLAEELGRVFDRSLDVICVLDAGFRLVRVSRASEKLWGYTPEELSGRSCLELVPPQDRAVTATTLTRIRGGVGDHSVEGRALRKDGSVAPVVWSAVWCEAQQEMYCIARDDTERRSLISHLKARSHELQIANDDLRTFSQSVSHDLRSPVSTIAGFVDKVLRDDGATLSARSANLLQRSLGAATRMDQLISDLLRLAQISVQGVRRCPCDLGAIAQDIAESLRQGQPGFDVEFVAQPQLQAWADPQLLRIALENLIGNAWKFTARTHRPQVTVGREVGRDDVFFVRDNGAGFDMAHAAQIFAPFRRLHTSAEFEGTGIGLSIVHRVIAGHGGRIWAEASPGGGAVFRFTLGAQDRGSSSPLPLPAANQPHMRPHAPPSLEPRIG